MSIRKFRFPDLSSVEPGSSVTLEKEEEKHLFRILRAVPGDEVELLDGKGSVASARVGQGRTLEICDIRHVPVPERRVHLYLAPPRRQKMDQILRECTELGVWRIVPVLCEFSVSEPDASSVSGRWNDALFEACKQSGNPFLPETCPPLPFAEAWKDASSRCGTLFYGSTDVTEKKIPSGAGDRAWFVGPEGGFSASELALLKESAVPLKIGSWILRVETAAAAGIVRLLND